MKLVFPNGEHGQALLSPGVNRIGSSSDGAAVLKIPGVEPVHCEIHITNTGANLRVPAGGGAVTVNGKPVTDLMALRAGDQIGIGPVSAKFAIVEAARSAPSLASGPEEDSGATRLRQAIPKYLLRGVSGAVFGKIFPITGPVVIGRATECDISVTADEISRRHALVKPTPEGLSVEDLGSSNGTFINGKRVQQGFLNSGDELRLDAVRFIMVAPGQEISQAPTTKLAAPAPTTAAPAAAPHMKWVAIMLTLAAIAVIATLVMMR